MANWFHVIASLECGICTSLPSLIVGMEPGKRHIQEAATDWLNPLSLGTMSASA